MTPTVELDARQAREHVVRKQGLGAAGTSIVEVTDRLVGLHGTNPTGPYLSLHARLPSFDRLDFDTEYDDGRIARIRCMRNTIFVLTEELIPIAYAATRGKLAILNRRFREFHGLDDPARYRRQVDGVLEVLGGQELTARQIRDRLTLDADLSAVLQLMGDDGLVVRGRPFRSWKDRTQTYRVFREALPEVNLDRWEDDAAIRELVGRYIASYGPVTETDIAWWSGLGKTPVRAALSQLTDHVRTVRIAGDGRTYHMTADDLGRMAPGNDEDAAVALLPSLDPYVMGYKERDRFVDEKDLRRVFDRSGNATATIVVDGRIRGVWDLATGPNPEVRYLLFAPTGRDVRTMITSRAQAVGSFMTGAEVTIGEYRSMRPLDQRTAGSVMTPLDGAQPAE